MTEKPTRVFISYSWDSEEHKEEVLRLANTLRNPWGIETDLDQYVRAKHPYTPEQGWDIWMEKRIEWAEFVLVVCTETYKRRFRGDEEPGIGRGVTWEGTIIRQTLYNEQLRDTKFIPVVFSAQDLHHVPIILNGHDKYVIEDDRSLTELCYRLRKQPTIAMPDVASAKLQPPPKPKYLTQTEPPAVFLNVAELQEQDTSPRKDSESTHPIDTVALESERGVDYSNLRDLLKAGEWRKADEETLKVMLKAAQRESQGWLDEDGLKNFPCKDLRTIDRLWVTASNGHFGFSVQKKIWQECGRPTRYYENDWTKFGARVGWRRKRDWLNDKELEFSIDFSPAGELPCNLRGTSMGARGGGTGIRVERYPNVNVGSLKIEYVIVVSLFWREDL